MNCCINTPIMYSYSAHSLTHILQLSCIDSAFVHCFCWIYEKFMDENGIVDEDTTLLSQLCRHRCRFLFSISVLSFAEMSIFICHCIHLTRVIDLCTARIHHNKYILLFIHHHQRFNAICMSRQRDGLLLLLLLLLYFFFGDVCLCGCVLCVHILHACRASGLYSIIIICDMLRGWRIATLLL